VGKIISWVLESFSEGGMGEVYRVEHMSTTSWLLRCYIVQKSNYTVLN